MKIPGKEIFTNDKVLLVGYSKNPSSFSRMVYHSFEESGVTVYPYNPNKANYDVKVYSNFSEIENIPEVASIVLGKESLSKAIDSILDSGVKRLIINNKSAATPEIIKKCNDKGIEVDVLCPLLIVGTGFHKIHKFFATLF